MVDCTLGHVKVKNKRVESCTMAVMCHLYHPSLSCVKGEFARSRNKKRLVATGSQWVTKIFPSSLFTTTEMSRTLSQGHR